MQLAVLKIPPSSAIRIVVGLAIVVAGYWAPLRLGAAEPWQEALARMPLAGEPAQLNRSNCVDFVLRSFTRNDAAKALIFMPGATDEFYMFRRARANLDGAHPTLLNALSALTNQTYIRLAFRSPFVLLHTSEDALDPLISVEHPPTVQKLRGRRFAARFLVNDRDWDFVQPFARDTLGIDIRPWRYSRDSWHFYRHSLVAYDLSGWEALEAFCLAGKSRFAVTRNRVTFEPDLRTGITPGFGRGAADPSRRGIQAKAHALAAPQTSLNER